MDIAGADVPLIILAIDNEIESSWKRFQQPAPSSVAGMLLGTILLPKLEQYSEVGCGLEGELLGLRQASRRRRFEVDQNPLA
jgi:hypothetical protein